MSERPPICGDVSESGPFGEPLACGYKPDHERPHSWATLPTFPHRGGGTHMTADWLVQTCLLFGADISTAYQAAGLFVSDPKVREWSDAQEQSL